jgi:hypothetical protein
MKITTLLHGEQSLAKEILKVIPLIEKHFKPFDGQKAAIVSGSSAGFKKVKDAFRKDCEAVTNAHVFIDTNTYSIMAKFKINEPDPEKNHYGGCNYFEYSCFIGKFDGFNYVYEFKANEAIERNREILSLTADKLYQAKSNIKRLTEKIETISNSFPYIFKDAINKSY